MEQLSSSKNNNYSYSYSSKKISLSSSKENLPNINLNSNQFNIYNKNLPFFSKKILEAKHNITPELYHKIILNNLVLKKRSHCLAYLNEIAINTNIIKEQLKRFYTYEESKTRVPKYVSYYHNYLKFFCKPVFDDYFMNKKMVKHMEKVAQIFYNENYADDDENLSKDKKMKCNFKIFSKTINNEIDNFANFTKVYNNEQSENNKIFDINKNEQINIKKKEINKINDDINEDEIKSRNNYIELLENIYKITPIIDIKRNKKFEKENKSNNLSFNYDDDTKKTEIDSYQKILNEISYKKKKEKSKENKENIFKKSSIFPHNSSIVDYFNGLSIMLFGKKKKGFMNKNNSQNNKFKKKDKNINTNNKIINNININIKHLTIGQKSLNPLSEVNNIYNNWLAKKPKKRIAKSRKHNSMILKDKSFKKYKTHFGNLTTKNLEQKKRNDSFSIFQIPKAIVGYNSNINNKKVINTNINSFVSNTRNKPKLKNGIIGKLNIGYITCLNKSKKNGYIKNQTSKTALYNNAIQNKNILSNKNLLNITNQSNSKIIKDISNKTINYNSNNNKFSNNKSTLALYKNSLAMISPKLYTKKYKNSNISLNKVITPMSFEKVKTTSHQSSQKSLGIIKYNNFISPKNNRINYKNKNNSKSHTNLRSSINIKNQGDLRKYSSILYKKKINESQQNNSKLVNLKYKNFVKFNGLKTKKNKIRKYQSYMGKKNDNYFKKDKN